MKKIVLFAIFTLTSHVCIAQKSVIKAHNKQVSDDISFITNKKIKYSIPLTICDTCATISNIGGFKVFVDLSEKEEEIVRRINKKAWLMLLKNPKTDWAANLILYDIFDKNALLFSFPKLTRKDWLVCLREQDLKFWKNRLPTH